MARSLLLLTLFIAMLSELVLAGIAFFAPAFFLAKLGLKHSADTALLTYFVAWFLLFVGLTAGLAFVQLWNRWPRYAPICYLLGVWWIGIGAGIYLLFGRPEHLLLDSAKGLLLVVLTWRCQATRMMTRRY
jgi:hypothetical protein